ncbi:MAG: transglutaminase-like cysteine peptidase [Burkholderiales bacterium]
MPAPLIEINQTLNHRIVFAEDALNGGRADHWATPGELLSRGAGDCEDYAIAKYFALLSAGLPAAQLRIAHVMVLMGGTGDVWRSHMVLAYLPSATIPGGELILDNLLDDIRPLAERPDLRVLISFDTVGVWAALDRGEPPREARRIVRWARVLDRMGLDRQTDARGREVALPMNP